MDKEFSEALNKTVKTFGKDIVKEKRFVDIVCDYYPAMVVDHPAWKKVLTTIIVEDFGKDILVCNNSVDARLCIDKYTALVAKKNGFDKKLVEEILMELCSVLNISVAYPSQNRPTKPINPKPQPKKKPITKPTPAPKSNSYSKKPRGNANNSPKHVIIKRKALIIITAIVAILIIVSSAVYTYYNCYLWTGIDFPTWPVIILTALIWIYLVIVFQESRSGWGVAFIILFISFKISLILICIPQEIVQKGFQHSYIERLSEKIKKNNENSKVSKENHLKENMTLGFMGINIDGDANIFEMLKSDIHAKETPWTEKFNTIDISTGSISESYDSVYSEDVLDAVLLFQTKWDSKNIEIKVGTYNGRILALEIYPRNVSIYDKFDTDSILKIYESKYGKSEEMISYFWQSITKHSSVKIYKSSKYISSREAISDITSSYMWSFKNGYIILYRKEDDLLSTFSNIDKILYISKELELLQDRHLKAIERREVLRQQQEKQEKVRQEQDKIKKQKRDSIKRQREHSRAVNQI